MLGPKVLMVYSMVIDLLFFLGLLGMAMICYGVSTQSLITPNKLHLTLATVFGILWRPYLNLFGELGLPEVGAEMTQGYCQWQQVKSTRKISNSLYSFRNNLKWSFEAINPKAPLPP